MEPGDLRINSRLRDDGGVPRGSPSSAYPGHNDANSVLHFRNQVRPAVITDGRLHHIPSSLSGPPLALDRAEQVKVWRDPSLINSTEIRHVVSMQHSGVLHLTHPHAIATHPGVNAGAAVYQQHDNKSFESTSRGPHSVPDGLRGRAPVVYAPPSNNKPQMENWRPGPAPGPIPGPGVLQNAKDFRVNLTSKSTVEQAVHDHFVESLRLAHLKGNAQQPVMKQEERPNSAHAHQRYYHPQPQPDKRMPTHDMQAQQVMYQIHQHQMSKPELPAPPPLRSEAQYRAGSSMDSGRKHQIYGPPEVMGRSHVAAQATSSIRYEPEAEVAPSENCVRYRNPHPAPRRPTTQSELQLERNRSPFGKQVTPSASPNSYHVFPQAHMNKHKVSSPAPPHIYGKPGPSSRPYDVGNESPVPLPLTSKGGLTRPSQSSPSSYSHSSPSLPQHDVRKADVAYYMYNNGPPGFQPSVSPQQAHSVQTHNANSVQPHSVNSVQTHSVNSVQAHNTNSVQAHNTNSVQTQPLDLGGKRKMEDLYKNAMSEPLDHALAKALYGSRKADETVIRPKISHAHVGTVGSPVPLSLTLAESPPKRKIDDGYPVHHLDTKKVRCEVPVVVTPNMMLERKDHDMKPIGSDYMADFNRAHIPKRTHMPMMHDLPVKVKAEMSPVPLPLDVRKPVLKFGAVETKPVVATMEQTPICNGKHNEGSVEELQPVPLDLKPNLDTTKAKVESTVVTSPGVARPCSTPSSSTVIAVSPSVTPTPPPTAASTVTTKFQKLGKKAWVLQWHEGDSSNNNSTDESNLPKSNNGFDSSIIGASTSTGTTNQCSSSSDKVVSDDGNKKLVNGHLAGAATKGNDSSVVGGTNSQSVNGFGKERLNDSDICSENESDNSNKEKALTDSSTSSPTKKNGRKGKDCSQASHKPDLRKDGLCKRPPVSQLKKTGESFIQADTCNRVTPKVGKCRECRWQPSSRSKKQSGAYCRFYGFRKLRYTKGGSLTIAGFSDPFTDPPKITEHDQFRLWLPSSVAPENLDADTSKFVLSQLCDQFCDLVKQEEEARCLARTQELSYIAWKPLLKGVLEMCDVCDTTLFNFHWACGKCGFVVCLSCFKARKNADNDLVAENVGKDRDEFHWLLCSNRNGHELDKLMLVQTIAGDALLELNKKLHNICSVWNIVQGCGCKNMIGENPKSDTNTGDDKPESTGNSTASEEKKSDASPNSEVEKIKESPSASHNCSGEKSVSSSVIDNTQPGCTSVTNGCSSESNTTEAGAKSHTGVKTESEYPSAKHSWLCNGSLLRLLDPQNVENNTIFHEQWKRGLPILVSNVADKLDKSLWTPESFSKEFGDYKNDMYNYVTQKLIPNQPMRKFWEGFTNVSKRLKDDKGEPMLLKLKDWPSTDDFAPLLPKRFEDLMAALPLPDYTLKEGKLNLANRLPAEFMTPDLGPKMYIAYGSGTQLDKGTTNLHLDISDAVNVLVHSEAPQDIDVVEHEKAVLKAMEESDCDAIATNRIIQKKEVPGALWHIYNAKDADKIRDLLNKVGTEKGVKDESQQDPIHDQNWYLDSSLRQRLKTEYNISGYPILQCVGDAIFIPAGAPHQVLNLQNCIKVAEDFVSPENISQTFRLAEECCKLSKKVANYEDKLQIKNIVYHAVKDAITVLLLQNKEKSESTSKNTNDAFTALSKDCRIEPSTSQRDPPGLIVNSTSN